MIYRQTKHSIQTDEAQRGINFNLYLTSETPFLLKSLLVIYYYLKEKKVIPQREVSKMS
jgi:hypothetical protein